MTTPTGSELAKALLKVQAELKPIPRKRKGQSGSRGHKYADLSDVEEAVFPLLNRAGLAWITKPTTTTDGRFVLYYAMVHAATAEREEGEYPLHGGGNAQQQGSEVTYARRYCLCAVTGAVAEGEDDDGARAAEARGGPGRTRPPQRPTAPVARTRTTGTDHERLRHGTVEPTPDDRPAQRARRADDDDPWADQPPGELPQRPNRIGAIQAHFKRLGVTDRDVRLGYTAQLLGLRQVASTNDLTEGQARAVLDRLAQCKDEKALRALLDRGDAPEENQDA